MATYKAYAATEAKGKCEIIELPVPELKPEEVEVDVMMCGICHSDLSLVDGEWGPFSAYPNPQVSGHEVVGTVVKVGSAVSDLKPGMRVGVGWQCASCLSCEYCNIEEGECCVGACGCVPTCAGGNKGGFAEKVFVQGKYAIPLPEAVDPEFLGPLMCGGITIYKPLVTYSKPGDTVGIVGMGGIGGMGVMFAKARGCKVIAFSTSSRQEAQAKEWGVDQFVVTSDAEAMKAVENTCNCILYTPNVLPDLNPFIACLAMKGKMAFVGAITQPPALPIFGPPIMKDLVFAGSHIGGPKLMKEMVDVVASKGLKLPCSIHPFSEINECLDKMRANKADGRMVLKW